MSDTVELAAMVPQELHGERLDQVAAQLFPDYSRSRLQAWIKKGELLVDGQRAAAPGQGDSRCAAGGRRRAGAGGGLAAAGYRPGYYLRGRQYPGTEQAGRAGGPSRRPAMPMAPWSTPCWPTRRNWPSCPGPASCTGWIWKPRASWWSPRTLAAHHHLVAQLQARTVKREYCAVCIGAMTGGGTIDAPMGRHPRQRKKMAVLSLGGKSAITHYRVAQRLATTPALPSTWKPGAPTRSGCIWPIATIR